MKFNINKSEFLNALTVVSKGTSSKPSLPIYSGVCITTGAGQINLQAAGQEQAIKFSAMALIEDAGATVIPEKLLLDIVKSLPEAAVTIEQKGSEALITCENASFKVHTMDAEDFPSFPEVDIINRISVPFDEFAAGIKRTAKVASKDQARMVLTGVLMETVNGMLRMVATDSYRMAMVDIPAHNIEADFSAIVSASFLQEIAGLPKIDDLIEIGLAENQIVLKYQNMVLINRRMEGNFPNYRQLLPKSCVTKTCFNTQDLVAGVKRVGIINNSSSAVKLSIDKEEAETTIKAASQDVGVAEETISSEVMGENIQIAFNNQYLLDGLSSVSTDQVILETNSPQRPGIFKSSEGVNFLYLVMPVRID